ncbi:MAG: ABC-F family ATP-binding cassette domain-containing protein [Bacteroidia bacterium]|nr:ABC-F family ATP-binding cassette domain-containing protein [Bacteroidia bacterium]
MNYLSVENLSRRFGDRVLFENLSFGIERGDKIAFIAPNGTGKSSLMRILAGLEPPDNGQVIVRNGIRVALLEQEPHFDPGSTVIESVFEGDSPIARAVSKYQECLESGDTKAIHDAFEQLDNLDAWDFEAKAEQILAKLKVRQLKQLVENLSGGQKRRLALAKILLSEPDLLLLDEPTNHLDIDMVEWLENYLSANNITLFMVTHDRFFLDRVCNEILELDNRQLYTYKGNYNYFLEKREERYANLAVNITKAKNLYSRELEWIRKQPKARTTKSQSRIDAFEDLSKKANQKITERQLHLKSEMIRLGNKVINAHNIGMQFNDEEWLFLNFAYKFLPGERVGILGNNGSGKSTLVKILTQQLKPSQGHVDIGDTVVFGYFGQDGLQYKEGQRIIELVKEIAENFELPEGKQVNAAQLLERFLFPRNSHYTPIAQLSGGEKRRLYLLTVLLKKPNVLILDEPTNDLDILTLNVLEDYLENFAGCLIIISHDRFFLDKLCDHLFVFEQNRTIKDYPGNYSQYKEYFLQKEPVQPEPKMEKSVPKQVQKTGDKGDKKKLSYKEKVELENIPQELEDLEQEKQLLTDTLTNPALSHEELHTISQRLSEIMNLIDTKEIRWLELSE